MLSDEMSAYVDAVRGGQLPAGRLVRLAVDRYLADREIGGRRGLTFKADEAERVIEYFSHLRLTTGEYAGQGFQLRPWQKFILWNLFGWYRADGLRRFRDALVSVARGNGKSPFAAGLAIYLGFCDGEARSEVFCFATTRDQAKIVFEEAQRLVEQQPDLNEALDTRVGVILRESNYSTLKPLGSDSKNTDGLIPHGVILDELHEWRDQHRGLYDKIETAMGKRRQPLVIKITTAGEDTSDLWREQYDYSRKILEQTIQQPDQWLGDDHFAFVAEMDRDDDIWNEDNWPKANPMLLDPASPVKIDHLRSLASRAQQGDPIAEMRFRRYHGNQPVVGLERLISAEIWKRGDNPPPDGGGKCYLGLDLARSNDFAAVSLCEPLDREPRQYACQTWAWTVAKPTDMVDSLELQRLRRTADNLFVLPGEQIDFGAVRRFIIDLASRYWIVSVAYDRVFATETAQLLTEAGLPMIVWAQTGQKYHEPITRFMQELTAGNILHGGDDLLTWQALNMTLKPNATKLAMPDKSRKDRKIDSMVALLMAFGEAITCEKAPALDYYASHKLESF